MPEMVVPSMMETGAGARGDANGTLEASQKAVAGQGAESRPVLGGAAFAAD